MTRTNDCSAPDFLANDPEKILRRHFETAKSFHRTGDLAAAEAIYSRLLILNPADSEVLFFFAHLRVDQGDLTTGLECLTLAQQLNPSDSNIPYTRGVFLQLAEQLPEAIAAYHETLRIAPNMRPALENLCAALYDLEKFPDALAAAQNALQLDPTSTRAIRGVANCHAALGQRECAFQVLTAAMQHHPATPELRIHLAWETMARGDWKTGWRALEWRHSKMGGHDAPPRSVPFPRWDGEYHAGQSLLIYGEQGIGDEIMFARWIPQLISQGIDCIIECEERLEPIFSRSFPGCRLLHRDDTTAIPWQPALSGIRYAISSLSLPIHTRDPGGAPYLHADSKQIEDWRAKLRQYGPGLKIGLSWRGGGQEKVRHLRSIPPELFGPLVTNDACFFSVQYGATAEEIGAVSPRLIELNELDPLIDLDTFAAALSALDVLITVDNSTAHLAGALGVKTLLLLPVYSEWRWGNQTHGASPWYDSVTQIRAPSAGPSGWGSLIEHASDWLRAAVPDDFCAIPPAQTEAQFLPAVPITPPSPTGRTAVLVADTHYWYHWGCSCTSIGLHEGLRDHFDQIQTIPLIRLLAGCPSPSTLDDLDSDAFFDRFAKTCPDIVATLERATSVVINGEGSIHGARPLPLTLLYLAYIAATRLGKFSTIVNHSCFPGDSLLKDGSTTSAYYARVYSTINAAVTREQTSLGHIRTMGGHAIAGFDCLPLFLERHPPSHSRATKDTLVLGGSVTWTPALIAQLQGVARLAADQGLNIQVLSGAKAFLAADEIGFVEHLMAALKRDRLTAELVYPLNEAEWLATLGRAALVVSGRFHYSIAAAFQGTPFLVAESNTDKIGALLTEFELDRKDVFLAPPHVKDAVHLARHALRQPGKNTLTPEVLTRLRERARLNFSIL